jgi:integrase
MAAKKRDENDHAPGRAADGESSFYYSETDGYWHGRVIVGTRDDGTPDRRHCRSKDKKKALEKFQALKKMRDAGTVRKPGMAPTVNEWLTHWLENIAAPSVRYKTLNGYRTAVHHHLIPGLGAHRIDKVQPEHFEKLYKKIIASGRKPATAHQVHRVARTAFGEAYRRGTILRNPVELAKPPRVEEEEIEPYEIDEIKRLIAAAMVRRNGVRFVIALSLGLRQGEALGLKWSRFDAKTKTLQIKRQVQRRKWEHGCKDSHGCGAKFHKVEPCKKGCFKHKRECPPPCPADCTEHARHCPERHGGGLVEAEVKSRAGRRGIALPEQLVVLLVAHREAQDEEREHAGTVWRDEGWMFAQPDGRPIDPRSDWEEWKNLLMAAHVRDGRLHDARHTAATVLLLLGVPTRAVEYFMGWSNGTMARRYQHVIEALKRDIADRIDGYLWEPMKPDDEDENPAD